ncbi:peroxide stress protein YaaA [Streptomyces lonarensis]|uniref:Peroxide stress protein YaaA n=1 Tax=Streptomyces lonarensis TaxID=700599 RepID=A0A7X6HY47_9ACTN|nr:peroxide stress protein YaaA [Streptomyces lonarensis]NJQ05218.1 peroxide stress protein YaaA [Streptomyces lonarensis]
MLVLLPPSEGKADGHDGPPLDLSRLSLPSLTPARESVLAELTELCAADTDKAREVLGLSERQSGEVVKNTALRTAPTLPAGRLYTGVLYDALGLATLEGAAAARAERTLLVFSGLWGALHVGDAVPSYRCSGGVRLPALGALARYWRGPLSTALPEAAAGRLVLDLRSTAYAGMWKPDPATARRTTTVRVLQSRTVDGVEKRSVVSHFNKATKGRVVRALLEAGAEPETPAQLADVLRDLGHQVESTAPGRLDIIVTEV